MIDAPPTPEENLDIAKMVSRLQSGPVSELEIQHLLGLRPTTARKLCDDLVMLGVAYRHNRELHLNVIHLTADADLSLRDRVLERLVRMPGTALSLSGELEAPLDVMRATLEALRVGGDLLSSTCGPLVIYRLSSTEIKVSRN